MPAQSRRSAPLCIFDLPLELRRLIYLECIPNGYQLQLNDDTAEWTIDNLRQAHPQFRQKIEDEENVRCTEVAFLVTSTKWSPPAVRSSVRHLTHVRVDIRLDEYIPADQYHEGENCECRFHEARRDQRMAPLQAMGNNLARFIIWLKASCAEAEAVVRSIRLEIVDSLNASEDSGAHVRSVDTGDDYGTWSSRHHSLTDSEPPHYEEALTRYLNSYAMDQDLYFNRKSMCAAKIVEYLSMSCHHEGILSVVVEATVCDVEASIRARVRESLLRRHPLKMTYGRGLGAAQVIVLALEAILINCGDASILARSSLRIVKDRIALHPD
ncbi:hypothetical protein CLAFUW4_12455 [Fulvia fulva]|uniref:Uncharacterized protein n=1 Tax=Passalora fulva TaxID=5499 RepID=A0A9Q8PF38_PASFU|nr:uncharacterized protein CLAFUR5_11483 [Fulvia fulva]KAK4617595.1 hypothetical protein CLAFUR4_12460 [Fulvia fulva]KAK4618523.1 hypothetical protein CLAFUR0_12471 [Fulvia fulva]UJO21336.1 hypothetical protein CLAFUR5_11483 [Fulvia fulva]WPV18487.1 hypothetical protein CLAFUW4_12455 [Fulvia fulva]WPV32766.1 hypothetical protein CLAFUW7_12462 [Fulvia fulva]